VLKSHSILLTVHSFGFVFTEHPHQKNRRSRRKKGLKEPIEAQIEDNKTDDKAKGKKGIRFAEDVVEIGHSKMFDEDGGVASDEADDDDGSEDDYDNDDDYPDGQKADDNEDAGSEKKAVVKGVLKNKSSGDRPGPDGASGDSASKPNSASSQGSQGSQGSVARSAATRRVNNRPLPGQSTYKVPGYKNTSRACEIS